MAVMDEVRLPRDNPRALPPSRPRRLTWLWILLTAIVTLIAAALVIGALTAREHIASVAGMYRAAPSVVWAAITDYEHMAEWRHGVQRIEILSPVDGRRRVREHTRFGPMTYELEVEEAPKKLVARIVDTDKGFGGAWTYEISEVAGGSRLTITERGFVDNVMFRFLARWVFGYDATLRGFHGSLAEKLGTLDG